jgi:hypothetical protein
MRTTTFILLYFAYLSCSEKQEVFKTITLMTTITTQKDGKRTTQDSISYLNSKFFQISLYRVDSNRYHAEIGIERPKSLENFRVSYMRIINHDSTILPFQSPSEFLEFMKVRGYVMIHQRKFDLYRDYVFLKTR